MPPEPYIRVAFVPDPDEDKYLLRPPIRSTPRRVQASNSVHDSKMQVHDLPYPEGWETSDVDFFRSTPPSLLSRLIRRFSGSGDSPSTPQNQSSRRVGFFTDVAEETPVPASSKKRTREEYEESESQSGASGFWFGVIRTALSKIPGIGRLVSPGTDPTPSQESPRLRPAPLISTTEHARSFQAAVEFGSSQLSGQSRSDPYERGTIYQRRNPHPEPLPAGRELEEIRYRLDHLPPAPRDKATEEKLWRWILDLRWRYGLPSLEDSLHVKFPRPSDTQSTRSHPPPISSTQSVIETFPPLPPPTKRARLTNEGGWDGSPDSRPPRNGTTRNALREKDCLGCQKNSSLPFQHVPYNLISSTSFGTKPWSVENEDVEALNPWSKALLKAYPHLPPNPNMRKSPAFALMYAKAVRRAVNRFRPSDLRKRLGYIDYHEHMKGLQAEQEDLEFAFGKGGAGADTVDLDCSLCREEMLQAEEKLQAEARRDWKRESRAYRMFPPGSTIIPVSRKEIERVLERPLRNGQDDEKQQRQVEQESPAAVNPPLPRQLPSGGRVAAKASPKQAPISEGPTQPPQQNQTQPTQPPVEQLPANQPWWQANVGKPIQVPIEEHGTFAEGAHDSEDGDGQQDATGVKRRASTEISHPTKPADESAAAIQAVRDLDRRGAALRAPTPVFGAPSPEIADQIVSMTRGRASSKEAPKPVQKLSEGKPPAAVGVSAEGPPKPPASLFGGASEQKDMEAKRPPVFGAPTPPASGTLFGNSSSLFSNSRVGISVPKPLEPPQRPQELTATAPGGATLSTGLFGAGAPAGGPGSTVQPATSTAGAAGGNGETQGEAPQKKLFGESLFRSGGGPFGSTAPPTTGSLFGSTTAAGSAQGHTEAKGDATKSDSLFSGAPAAGLFSTASTPSTGPFGTGVPSAGLFGSAAPPSSGVFGTATPATSTAPLALTAPESIAGGFFQTGTSAPAPAASFFGAPAGVGVAPGSATAPSTSGGLFGASAATPVFGASGGFFASATPQISGAAGPAQPSTGLFGTSSAPQSGAAASSQRSTGLFGTNSAPESGLFGSATFGDGSQSSQGDNRQGSALFGMGTTVSGSNPFAANSSSFPQRRPKIRLKRTNVP